MAKTYNSITEIIGNTPLLELNNIKKHFDLKCRIYAKLEYLNPAGSAKDRVAKSIIDDAKEKGILNKDTTIIEPTSGNTGIGLAALCANLGYKLIIVMPDNMSIERIKIMQIYGAEVILTDGQKGMSGAIEKAEELNKSIENSFIAGQFTNPANSRAHYLTTGPEIYDALDGKVDYFVAGIGTGGTITGTGEYLKEKNPDTKVIAVEPATSPVLSEGISGAHLIQGIGANFIPDILNTAIYDKIITVDNDAPFEYSKLLARLEGVLTGISSGAALSAAVTVAKELTENQNLVVLLPDTGDRYISTPLFE